MAGTTAFCGFGVSEEITYWNGEALSGDRQMAQAVKEDIHYLLYALSHSAAMNGVNETTHTVNVMTWWRILYIVCIAVFGLATVFCGVCYAVGRRKSTDQKTEKGA